MSFTPFRQILKRIIGVLIMKNSYKWLFILFNIVYFFIDYIWVTVMPNPLLFGWLTLHMAVLLFFPVVGAIVWGIYFNAFFKTQKHVP